MNWWSRFVVYLAALWRVLAPHKLPYWIQRADFTSAEYPPASFKAGLAALRGYDWQAELRLEEELTAGEQDFCMPGIGFM